MKLTIESTSEIKDIEGIQCRVWKATTPKGIECYVAIHRVIVPSDEDAAEFDAELEQMGMIQAEACLPSSAS